LLPCASSSLSAADLQAKGFTLLGVAETSFNLWCEPKQFRSAVSQPDFASKDLVED